MTRLRRMSPDMPGWHRRRQGRGFVYLDTDGQRLDKVEVERCQALVIPPAWTEVWICPVVNGHLQAAGTDDAGRRQYLYHPDWRTRRDREKFDFMLEFAARLPAARSRVSRDFHGETMTLERACATAFRLFDLGAFRIGSPTYAEENDSYGLVTLERRHIRTSRGGMAFAYVAKSGQERSLTVDDASLCAALETMRARRGPPDQRLLAFKDGNRWHDLTPEHVTSYLKEHLGDEASAKDFRTWQANVIAAAILATHSESTRSGRKRAVSETVRAVAEFLGNTPAVARAGYVDPRVIDLFEDGNIIDPELARRHMPVSGKRMPNARELRAPSARSLIQFSPKRSSAPSEKPGAKLSERLLNP